MLRSIAASLAVLVPSFPAATQQGVATYDLTFRTDWSAETHPVEFPPGPHFSPLIGGTHDGSAAFWQLGGLATPGIEQMAELGATTALRSEVEAAIALGSADQVLQYGGLPVSPGSRTIRFTARASHPYLTLVSMLAPSPDWFVGVSGLPLRENGDWADTIVVWLQVYDSGTDSGTTYLSPNSNTVPPEPIDHITTASGPFQGLPGPVGVFLIQRVASASVYGCGVNPAGSITVGSAPPLLGGELALRLDDPAAQLARPAASVLLFAGAPAATFPCGIALPGFGLAAPGAPGELLLLPPLLVVPGPALVAGPTLFPLPIPNAPSLAGASLFAQGALTDGVRAGLTDAVALHFGQ